MISLMVIIIPFILMGIFASRYYLGIMTKKLTESRILVLNEMSRNIDQLLTNIEATAQQVRFDSNVQSILSNNSDNSLEEAQTSYHAIRTMEKILFSSDNIISMYVVPTHINVKYYVTTVGFINKQDAMVYPWYGKMESESNSSFWVPTRLNELNKMQKEYIITYVSPVLQVSSFKTIGHLLISFKEESLRKILNRQGLEKWEKIMLMDDNGNTFYSSDRNYEPGNNKNDMFKPATINNNNGSFITVKGGKKMLTTYSILQAGKWRLVSEIPVDEFSKEIYQTNKIIYLIIGLSIFFSIGMAVLVYRGITKPLKTLVMRMDNVGDGDFSEKSYDFAYRNEIQKIHNNFNGMTARIEQLLLKNSQVIQQKNDAEFKALHAQISPHFLYNTLDAINWLAMLNNQNEISDMVKHLSQFFRNTLSDGKQIVTIEEEIKHIDGYIQLERFRYKNRFDVEYNLDTRLFKCYTLKFILQPFVENSLMHGFKERTGQGRIYIQLFSKENTVFFEIIDDGMGMTDRQIESVLEEKTDGYGISNVDERIKLKYGDNYGVRICSEPGKRTEVTISIPKIEHMYELEN